jgi:copper transport protein
MFQVLVWPGGVGSDDLVLQLMAADGRLLRAKEPILAISLPQRYSEPLERKSVQARTLW